ncbi:unnamed protein product [Leuciscus chuanchicus]
MAAAWYLTRIPRVEPQPPRLDLEQEWSAAPRGCLGQPGQCMLGAGRNWSEEFGTGSGESGRWHEQEQGQGVAVNAMWETEGLQTLGIVLIVCASLKLLHLLGLINFSEEMVLPLYPVIFLHHTRAEVHMHSTSVTQGLITFLCQINSGANH